MRQFRTYDEPECQDLEAHLLRLAGSLAAGMTPEARLSGIKAALDALEIVRSRLPEQLEPSSPPVSPDQPTAEISKRSVDALSQIFKKHRDGIRTSDTRVLIVLLQAAHDHPSKQGVLFVNLSYTELQRRCHDVGIKHPSVTRRCIASLADLRIIEQLTGGRSQSEVSWEIPIITIREDA